MPFPALGAAIAGGASLAGGFIANRGRSSEGARNRQFQREEAGRQMKFQERMRNTSWQAGVADMTAAGLNPALAYGQGGASSPVGAAGSGAQAERRDIVTPAVASALQYKRLDAEIKAIQAGVMKTRAETEAVRGRPGRILEPGVSRGVETMNEMLGPSGAFSRRNMQIVQYEVGNSAKNIADAIGSTIARMRRVLLRYAAPTIGSDRTRRRR